MKYIKNSGTVLGLMGLLALGACAPMTSQNSAPDYSSSNRGNVYSQARTEYGVVDAIERVSQGNGGIGGSGMGMGTVAGAVIGGVVGHQVGAGQGNTAATVLGAAGGAYVGHQMENQQQSPDHSRSPSGWRTGAISH
jgi:uncharacterized protein YcfJ